jgi:hypothetical protein
MVAVAEAEFRLREYAARLLNPWSIDANFDANAGEQSRTTADGKQHHTQELSTLVNCFERS